MGESLVDHLERTGLLAQVRLSAAAQALLSAFEATEDAFAKASDGDHDHADAVTRLVDGAGDSPVPGLNLALTLPNPLEPLPFRLWRSAPGEPAAFKLWLVIGRQPDAAEAAAPLLRPLASTAGAIVQGGKVYSEPDGRERVEPTGELPGLRAVSDPAGAPTPSILIDGSVGTVADICFAPSTFHDEGLLTLALDREALFIGKGSAGLGIVCPGFTLDDRLSEGAPHPADGPAWRGLYAKEVDFILPLAVPVIGGRRVRGSFSVAREGGARWHAEADVPATDKWPGFQVRLEGQDPNARGLSALAPTLVDARVLFPTDRPLAEALTVSGMQGDVKFAAGHPLVLRLRLARDPLRDPSAWSVGAGVEAQGEHGLLTVKDDGGSGFAKLFNIAALMATSLLTRGGKDELGAVLGLAQAMSSVFEDGSAFELRNVEIEATELGAANTRLRLLLDYSVSVRVTTMDAVAFKLRMRDGQPLRVRVRKAALALNLDTPGQRFELDFDRAETEIEDPGGWDLQGLDDLFDVIASRAGRGSHWLEVDIALRQKLGPVCVDTLVVRATFDGGATPTLSLRGMGASMSVPRLLDGRGTLTLQEGGFSAALRLDIKPLGLGVDAGLSLERSMVVLGLGVDLPAPIPLANSGLGLLGFGGVCGFDAKPNLQNASPRELLDWKPRDTARYEPKPGQTTIGAEAVVGTLPDLGWLFSSRAHLLVSAPAVMVRAGLDGRVLQPPMRMSDAQGGEGPGFRFQGSLTIDENALTPAMQGVLDLRPLLHVQAPLVAHFPLLESRRSMWFVHVGGDGCPDDGTGKNVGRDIGRVAAELLPDILGQRADAYVMARGSGLEPWPYEPRPGPMPITDPGGYVLAVGFSLHGQFGVRPVVWAALHANADVLLASSPVTMAGVGGAGGSLNILLFSIGVDATFRFALQGELKWFRLEVAGSVRLFWKRIRRSVVIQHGQSGIPDVPAPPHPLQRPNRPGEPVQHLPCVIDADYRVVAPLVPDLPDAQLPQVWADAIISLPFAFPITVSPKLGEASPSFDAGGLALQAELQLPQPSVQGTEQLQYTWELRAVHLADEDPTAVQPSKLRCAWSSPRNGGGRDVMELLLLTLDGTLWVDRMSDPSTEPARGALERQADLCRLRSLQPQPGWALGHQARRHRERLQLPPETEQADATVSRFAVELRHSVFYGRRRGAVLAVDLPVGALPPAPLSIQAGAVAGALLAMPDHVQPGRAPIAARDFRGHLQAPCTEAPVEFDDRSIDVLELVPTAALASAMLVLLVPRRYRSGGIEVSWIDATGQRRSGSTVALPGASMRQLLCCLPPAPATPPAAPFGSTVVRVRIEVGGPQRPPIGIVGLRGITEEAIMAAHAAVDAAQAKAVQLAEAGTLPATMEDKKSALSNPLALASIPPHLTRSLLMPGHRYMLHVSMRWKARMQYVDVDGKLQTLPSDWTDVHSTYRFQVRALPDHEEAAHDSDLRPTFDFQRALTLVDDVSSVVLDAQPVRPVSPTLFGRYLSHWTPGEGQHFHYRDDPVRAHFRLGHVEELARLYGLKLQLQVWPIDADLPENVMPFQTHWSTLLESGALSAADQRRRELALTRECPLPLPGASATTKDLALDPLRWYEASVAVVKLDGTDVRTRLRGCQFRTSRWTDPQAMLRGLGMDCAGQSAERVRSGDLVVSTPQGWLAALPPGDAAFDALLASLGHDDWPRTDDPRLSRLWAHVEGGWRFAGLMIESPEPLQRPARVRVPPAALRLEGAAAGTFGLQQLDADGYRALFLAATPHLLNDGARTLVLSLNVTSPQWGITEPLEGRISLPRVPMVEALP